jgi:hypothetical protein
MQNQNFEPICLKVPFTPKEVRERQSKQKRAEKIQQQRKKRVIDKALEEIILKRQAAGKLCFWCRSKPGHTHDHVDPRGIGGLNLQSNIVMACFGCNVSRGALVCWHLLWKKLRAKLANIPPYVFTPAGLVRSINKFNNKLAWYEEHRTNWAAIELARFGRSPSAALEFSVIEIPEVQAYEVFEAETDAELEID